MTMICTDIKFCGFHPTLATQKYIEDRLNYVLKEAPSGTCYNLILSKKDSIFKGIVTLISSARKYVVVAYGNSIDEVLRKIMKQIKKKFQKIKCPRFHRENFGFHFQPEVS